MTQELHTYQPVPVDVAAQIGLHYSKDIVIVLCWDAIHEQTHTTTWGRSAEDKLAAAEAGDTVAKAFGADVDQKRVYEDFRLDAARLKEENDRLKARIGKLIPRPSEHLSYADACCVIMELVRDYGDAECTVAWETLCNRLDGKPSLHEGPQP